MKISYILDITLVMPLALTLTSCENDSPLNNIASDDESVLLLTLNVSIDNSAQSRAQVQLGNYADNTEYALWNEGDAFSLYDLGANGITPPTTSSTFTITDYSNDNPNSTASFIGSCNITKGNSVFAIYPLQDELPTDSEIDISIPQTVDYESNSDAEVGTNMAKYMYMYSTGKMDGSNTAISFSHLTSMIRITYQNLSSEAQKISTVSVIGDGEYFGTSLKLNLIDGTQSLTVGDSFLTATFSDLSVAASDTIDIYLLFFPGTEFNDDGSLSLNIGEQTVKYSTSVLQSTCFSAGGRYWFDLTQTDDGLDMTNHYADFGDYVVIYNSVNEELCQALANWNSQVILDDAGNAIIPSSLIEETTKLSLNNKGLISIDGLECFKNLSTLLCENNSIAKLNASCFPNLTQLYCSSNNLTSLGVSGCTKLINIQCSENNLTSIDVSDCTALSTLSCFDNSIATLDLSGFTSLSTLDCSSNNLTSLDVSDCTALSELNCSYNNLSSLTLSGCVALSQLYCSSNSLTSLNVSDCSSLSILQCANSSLTALDVSGLESLSQLNCYNNKLISLDVSDCAKLSYIQCSYNKLTSLDVSDCAKLKTLTCSNSSITTLNVSGLTSLSTLDCSNNNLTSLDVSDCTALYKFTSNSNNLTILDVSGLTKLYYLSCTENDLTSLNVSSCAQLSTLQCHYNKLTNLDVSDCTALLSLYCYRNRLSSLDITSISALKNLGCGQQTSDGSSYIYLTLKLTSDQIYSWNSSWSTSSYNKYVTLSE